MREASPSEIRRVADRLRGRAERFDSQADEHLENEKYGLSGRKSDAAALDRRHAEMADELAEYLGDGGETDE